MGVNAYMQRHRDSKDMRGGLAGLFTLGSYAGGKLCVPQLGLKTRDAPGACAVLRGDKLEHMVMDYTGPRYFFIGSNHESVKRHALRKINGGSDSDNNNNNDAAEAGDEDDVGFPINTPCVQYGHDELNEPDRAWTNEELHEEVALPF